LCVPETPLKLKSLSAAPSQAAIKKKRRKQTVRAKEGRTAPRLPLGKNIARALAEGSLSRSDLSKGKHMMLHKKNPTKKSEISDTDGSVPSETPVHQSISRPSDSDIMRCNSHAVKKLEVAQASKLVETGKTLGVSFGNQQNLAIQVFMDFENRNKAAVEGGEKGF
jgi:hypothetical protein